MAKYIVRNYALHKVVVNSKGVKSTQIYQQGDPVELTDAEYQQYKHLVETEEQFNSRQKESKTTKKLAGSK